MNKLKVAEKEEEEADEDDYVLLCRRARSREVKNRIHEEQS